MINNCILVSGMDFNVFKDKINEIVKSKQDYDILLMTFPQNFEASYWDAYQEKLYYNAEAIVRIVNDWGKSQDES